MSSQNRHFYLCDTLRRWEIIDQNVILISGIYAGCDEVHPILRAHLSELYIGDRLLESHEITPIEWRDNIERWFANK